MKAKKRKKKSIKGFGVKKFCKACLSIRNGTYLLEPNCFPHTCRKTGKEIDELIFHSNAIIGLRGRDFLESMFLW